LKTGDVLMLAVSLTGGMQNTEPAKKKKKSPAKNSMQVAEQFEQADLLLKQMAECTGGRAYFPTNKNDFNSAYAQIAELVRHEYSLAFAPPVRDGLVHSVEVRVDTSPTPTGNAAAAAFRVNHRQAYLAPAPAAP
jgi:hypothetical protein